MPIVCAAVIGQLNNPLFLSACTPAGDDFNKLHTIVHCSLDAVDEKVLNQGRSATDPSDGSYLGLLYVVDDLRVYGWVDWGPDPDVLPGIARQYITNTKAKFLLVVDDPVVRDDELRAIFRRLHTAFVDAVSNPFYTPNTPITSPRFDASVRTIAMSLGALT